MNIQVTYLHSMTTMTFPSAADQTIMTTSEPISVSGTVYVHSHVYLFCTWFLRTNDRKGHILQNDSNGRYSCVSMWAEWMCFMFILNSFFKFCRINWCGSNFCSEPDSAGWASRSNALLLVYKGLPLLRASQRKSFWIRSLRSTAQVWNLRHPLFQEHFSPHFPACSVLKIHQA